jgi:HAE1 family hydrophobic/amphiphilic exporter-1
MTMIQQVAGSNANEIAKQVKAELDSQKKLMPPGMQVKINYDVTEFLYASIEEVVFTLFMTLALVFLVVYVFLQDMRSTLIPLIAVPVSLIGTFFFLNVMGFSINLLVLSALLLAIAIVVDDAIVVVEAVHAKLDQGYKNSLTASIDAMNEISGAIISITLVMAAVFVPVSFIGGTSGTFYREFGVTMAISIIISALNALTLSPALCAIFLKPHDKDGHEKKMSRVDRFHQSFNTAFDTTIGKYKNILEKLVRKPVAIIAAVIAGIVVLGITMFTTKSGLVPDEDTGTLFCTISMPPATSQERTKEVVLQVDSILSEIPAIQNREQVLGYNFIAGAGSDMGTFIIKLKPFGDRQKGLWWKISGLWEGDGIYRFFLNPYDATGVIAQIFIKTAHIKDAQILAFSPPMIPGFSANSGISLVMQDRTGGDLNKFFEIVKEYLAELNKRPEFQTAQTSYNPNYPQYMVRVDVGKCKQAGIAPTTVLTTLQGYYGGLYGSNFNSFGKLYKVMVQGSPETRMTPESLNSIYVRTPGGMAPVKEFCNMERVYGPLNINRFNLFTSINVTGTVANGYSTGEALKAVQEVAEQVLPAGYTYDFSGLTREEAKATNSTAIIFLLCFVFIYLILSAQYESYVQPLSVLLSVPFGLAGCFLFTQLFGHANDIYMQISLIMLIGLLAKNAILIVQFALERRQTGMAISWSAVLGAAARLRPILMTSLAMVIGLLPMMFASGVGKNGNQTLGAAAVGGMLIGTVLQLFVVPTLFVIFQSIQEKIKPLEFEDEENSEVAAELAQYAHKKPEDYKLEK